MGPSEKRRQIVDYLEHTGVVATPAVKRALLKVKREQFVLPEYREAAYEYNVALPIPGGVTISAINMHASFLSAAQLEPGDKVLEIGAGSGILLAYIKEVVGKGNVYGIEINLEAYEFAKKNLKKAGYARKVRLVLGDGSKGLPQFAQFDKIISSAASPNTPKPWIRQLKMDGILVTPVGEEWGEQKLVWIKKTKDGLIRRDLGGVVFVELKGKYGWGRRDLNSH